MKTNLSIASCGVLIAFAYLMAQAQDAYRDENAVDVSVRAGVEEQAQQSSQGGAKQQPTMLSSWSFQHATVAPAADKGQSHFGSSRPLRQVPTSTALPLGATTATVPDRAAERGASEPIAMPDHFGTSPFQGYGRANRPPAFTAPVSPVSSIPESEGLSKPFDRDLFGLTSYYPFSKPTHPKTRGRAGVWQSNRRLKKPSDAFNTTVLQDPVASKRR